MSTTGQGTKKLRDRDEYGHARDFSDEAVGPLGVIFCLLLIASGALILDYGVLPPLYSEKVTPPHDVYARLDFQYSDPDELNRQRTEAARHAPRVYAEDPAWTDTILADLEYLAGIVEVASNSHDAIDRTARFPHDSQLVDELFKYNEAAGKRDKYMRIVLLPRIRLSLNNIAKNGVLSDKDLQTERFSGEIVRISVARNGMQTRQRVAADMLTNVTNAGIELDRASWKDGLPELLQRYLSSHLQLKLRENLHLDIEQTSKEREAARSAVGNGDVDVHVRMNDLILNKNMPATAAELAKLHGEYAAWKGSLPWQTRAKHIAALGALIAGVLMIFLFVAGRINEPILNRRRPLVMLGILCLLALAATRAIMLAGLSAALAPLIICGMAASLAFGQSVALLTMLGLSVLTTFAGVRWEASPPEGGFPALSLALLAGGVAASLPASRLRERWDLLTYGLMGGAVQFALTAAMSQLGEGWPGTPTMRDALWALLNGPACGLLVLGALPLIEWLFGILTNPRLFELADMNQPALQRIQMEAPGTFAHTLQVRFLAEPAAKAIGANTRLVVAGTLYHDLGKTLKPEYFVENQMDAEARHKRLRPSVSALLITAHVKDGIELAREYGLPQQIVDFIPEHHGTTLVSYFFHSARKTAQAEEGAGADTVQEAFFRYPGPKPQSRETGIVMLADTVEAASRTLLNPSAARLRGFVHELIMGKMLDGQLDECDLTFADLAQIEDTFVRVLVTRFHSRPHYPGQDEAQQKVAEPSATRTAPAPAWQPGEAAAREQNPEKAHATEVARMSSTVIQAAVHREALPETRILGTNPRSET